MRRDKPTTAPLLTRRSTVLGLAGAVLAGTALEASSSARADFKLELEPPLRSRTQASGIRYGCAGAAPIVQPDRILLEKFAIEANIFSPEGSLKWIQTEPQPGTFDFAEGDSIAAFAARNDMLIHGHTLVWYTANPDWVANLKTGQEAQAALERHINIEVTHYRRKIWAWDVVNEALEPDDHLADDYRDSVWFRRLGAGYIDLSFRLARAVDPQVPLCLSEYGIEYTGPKPQRRRAALLALLRKLREQNTPVDCLSLQSHLEAHQTFDRAEFTGFLREAVKLGYRLMITELDVNDCRVIGNPDQRDRVTAHHLAEYLDIVFGVAKPLSIATWGLSDRSTWLRQYWKRADGSPLRPLPLDANLDRKPMWAVLARYLAGQERHPT